MVEIDGQIKQIGSWIVELTKENQLGKGGMGEVYLAKHSTLGSLAAIKFLPTTLTNDQEFSRRFFEEAKMQARLKHANIAQVMDCIVENGQLFLVMEYLEGGTLADIIDKNKTGIEEKQAIKWIKQVLDALNYAHQNGVIHRDIKPTNIMLDKHGNAKVLDFGIALEMTADRKTKTGISIGTPHYMSPEQIRNPKGVDHRTDVYSTAIVLYEMLTGRVPFDGDSDFDIREAQVKNNPPLLTQFSSNTPRELEEIVLRGLAKDLNQRFSGCGEFLQTIEKYEQKLSADYTKSIQTPIAATKNQPKIDPKQETSIGNREPSSKLPGIVGLILILAIISILTIIGLLQFQQQQKQRDKERTEQEQRWAKEQAEREAQKKVEQEAREREQQEAQTRAEAEARAKAEEEEKQKKAAVDNGIVDSSGSEGTPSPPEEIDYQALRIETKTGYKINYAISLDGGNSWQNAVAEPGDVYPWYTRGSGILMKFDSSLADGYQEKILKLTCSIERGETAAAKYGTLNYFSADAEGNITIYWITTNQKIENTLKEMQEMLRKAQEGSQK